MCGPQLHLDSFCMTIGQLGWEKIDMIRALTHLAALLDTQHDAKYVHLHEYKVIFQMTGSSQTVYLYASNQYYLNAVIFKVYFLISELKVNI